MGEEYLALEGIEVRYRSQYDTILWSPSSRLNVIDETCQSLLRILPSTRSSPGAIHMGRREQSVQESSSNNENETGKSVSLSSVTCSQMMLGRSGDVSLI